MNIRKVFIKAAWPFIKRREIMDLPADSCVRDTLLHTSEQLKGRLVQEVVVDKQTLVEAARAQNKTLLLIHEQLHKLQAKLDGVEEHFTKRIEGVDAQIEQWGCRVEALEARAEVRV